MMMKYVFISMDHFYIAAFVTSSKLMISHKMHPMLSQELYFQIPVFEKINTHQRLSADLLFFFCFPQKRPKFTHLTRGRGVNGVCIQMGFEFTMIQLFVKDYYSKV